MTIPPEQDRTPPGAPPSDAGMRASDDDRAATVRRLQDAVGRGLLTPDEGSERMAAAWAAVLVRDLGPLTADLPAPRPPAGAPGWGVLATMAAEQVRSSLHGARTGRLSAARIAGALLVALAVALLVGSLLAELLFDGPGPGRGGFGDR
jgi:Domain of unknown function (DUF1707)